MGQEKESENEQKLLKNPSKTQKEGILAGIIGLALSLFILYFGRSYIPFETTNISNLLYITIGVLIGIIAGIKILER